jgi:hypothetical protein
MLGVSSPPAEEPSPPAGRHPIRGTDSLAEDMLNGGRDRLFPYAAAYAFRMRARWSGVRVVALIAVGGLWVHDLRYQAGYGHDADRALAESGHGYLGAVALLVGALTILAVGHFVLELVWARRVRALRRVPLWWTWLLFTAALLALYLTQEALEGWLHVGHPAGLDALTGHGGWVVLIAAPALAALLAMLQRGAEAALATPLLCVAAPWWAAPEPRRVLGVCGPIPRDPLAEFVGGRAPPLLPA